MTRYQVEIDAPILLRVEADNEEQAEERGDAAYAVLWEAMEAAVDEKAAELNMDANLGARYDNTDVSVIDEETGDVR